VLRISEHDRITIAVRCEAMTRANAIEEVRFSTTRLSHAHNC
jgi:hypothetical protein